MFHEDQGGDYMAYSASGVIFNPPDQGDIARAAAVLFADRQAELPKIPWLSHTGQQQAFIATVKFVHEAATTIAADPTAHDAIVFWSLSIIYANIKMFRVATNAIKRDPWMLGDWTPARTFVDWVGSETHPAEVVRSASTNWRS